METTMKKKHSICTIEWCIQMKYEVSFSICSNSVNLYFFCCCSYCKYSLKIDFEFIDSFMYSFRMVVFACAPATLVWISNFKAKSRIILIKSTTHTHSCYFYFIFFKFHKSKMQKPIESETNESENHKTEEKYNREKKKKRIRNYIYAEWLRMRDIVRCH